MEKLINELRMSIEHIIKSHVPTALDGEMRGASGNIIELPLIKAAPAMYEALKRIMALDDSGALEAVAYSGGDIPKKWMREEAPAIDARSKARKEIQDIIRPIIAQAEERTP